MSLFSEPLPSSAPSLSPAPSLWSPLPLHPPTSPSLQPIFPTSFLLSSPFPPLSPFWAGHLPGPEMGGAGVHSSFVPMLQGRQDFTLPKAPPTKPLHQDNPPSIRPWDLYWLHCKLPLNLPGASNQSSPQSVRGLQSPPHREQAPDRFEISSAQPLTHFPPSPSYTGDPPKKLRRSMRTLGLKVSSYPHHSAPLHLGLSFLTHSLLTHVPHPSLLPDPGLDTDDLTAGGPCPFLYPGQHAT